MIVLGPDTRPDRRHYRPEPPVPRQDVAYRCERGHGFEVTFATAIEPPRTWRCRCDALGYHLVDGQVHHLVDGQVHQSEHERRMEQLRKRRSPAELEQILAERLAELTVMRGTT